MSVVELDIYAPDDVLGTPLVTLTDDDIGIGDLLRMAENELGAGSFTIRRDHPSATAVNLAGGNYVKVRLPHIQSEPLFGFWLDEHDDTVISKDEKGQEILVRTGPGQLAILRNAALLDQFYNGPLGGTHRGNYNVPGYWTWDQEPFGAILVRLIEEGQLEPGTPLQDVTTNFTRTHDSAAATWPDFIDLVQFDIGTNGLDVYARLIESGHLFVRMDPDTFDLYGYGTSPGVDRSSGSFASGKVRFEKATNIAQELDRKSHGMGAATHLIIKGKDGVYRQVVSPSFTTGPGRWDAVDYPNSNSADLLDLVGEHSHVKRVRALEGIEFEILPGDDEANGLYLPGKHFLPGDLCTIHTGSDPWDYNEETGRIIGYRLVLDEAVKDGTTDEKAKSIHVVVEVNWGETSEGLGSYGSDGGFGDCPFWVQGGSNGAGTQLRMKMRGEYTEMGASQGVQGDADTYLNMRSNGTTESSWDLFAYDNSAGRYTEIIGEHGDIVEIASRLWEADVDGTGNSSKHYLIGGWGLVIPVQSADPASGASEAGQLYYNDVSETVRWYNGTVWQDMGAGGGGTLTVDDGGTPVASVDTITFVGATVTDDTGGAITVTITGGAAQFDEDVPRYRFKPTFNTLSQEDDTTEAELALNGGVGAPYAALRVDDLAGSYAGIDMAGATGALSAWSKGGPIDFYPGDGGATPGENEKFRIVSGHGLVVPSLAADPAGGDSEAGQIYFNSGSGTFRGYDGTTWGELPLV